MTFNPHDLKSGDLVIVRGNANYPDRLARVARLTPTQIILEGGYPRFKRKNGLSIGSGVWSSTVLVEATPERINAVKQRRLANRLIKHDWRGEALETLNEIMEILEK